MSALSWPFLVLKTQFEVCSKNTFRNIDPALVYGLFVVTFNHNDNYSTLEK